MSTGLRRLGSAVAVLLAAGLIAAGCGSDDESTTATDSDSQSVEQTVDSAVDSCTDAAQDLDGSAQSAVEAACNAVGEAFKQDLSAAGDDVAKATSEAAKTCRQDVEKLPSGDPQDALTSLCDSIESAGDGG